MPALELAADDHTACRIDAVDLKNRLGNIETNRRDRLHAHLLPIVVTPSATTSMALTCRWRSRPQHQEPNRLHDLRKVARRPKWASRSRMEPLIYQNLAVPGSSPRRMRPATM